MNKLTMEGHQGEAEKNANRNVGDEKSDPKSDLSPFSMVPQNIMSEGHVNLTGTNQPSNHVVLKWHTYR